ncbi:MAG: 2-oxoacid:acceptor oxidoreductase family protein [Thermoplasmata archaeon]
MRKEIRIAGFGGQGIVLSGFILGQAALLDGKNAVQSQSYGPEARGGSAKSEVIISDEKIDYPRVTEADVFIAMSQEAYDKLHGNLKKKGLVLVDRDLVEAKGEGIKAIPFTATADKLGKKIVANVVMLGALTAMTEVVSKESIMKAIKANVPRKAVDINMKAFNTGYKLGGG